MHRILFTLLMFFLMNAHCYSLNIAVVTMAIGDEYEKQCYPSTVNKEFYCQKHDYDFHYFNKSLDESRHVIWSKILAIQVVMKRRNYDWIFWTDADSMITNMDVSLESLIDAKYEIIITKDQNGINAGQFLVKCSKWSYNFMDKVYSHVELLNHPWREQQAMVYEYKHNKHTRKKIKILHQRKMNSYVNNWQPGDFIIHFAGLEKENLYEMLKSYR